MPVNIKAYLDNLNLNAGDRNYLYYNNNARQYIRSLIEDIRLRIARRSLDSALNEDIIVNKFIGAYLELSRLEYSSVKNPRHLVNILKLAQDFAMTPGTDNICNYVLSKYGFDLATKSFVEQEA